MRLTRREFVASAAAAGLALRPRRALAAPRGRVVVVGAGLAGLAAAHELRRAGWEVVVLEARRRIGGRVLTFRSQFLSGQHAEAGGEYVDTSHATLLAYVKKFGLRLEDVRGGPGLRDVVYRNDRRKTDEAVETTHVREEIARFWDRVDGLAGRLDPADPVAAGASLDERTAADLLDELRLDPTARWLVEHELRDEFTVEADELSLLFVAQDARLNAKLPESGVEAYRIRGGNDQLPQELARGLDLTLGHAVRKIEASPTSVRVDGIGADYCVLTAPVPAWRAIAFSPQLPSPLPDAMASLQYGHGTKTMLQYERRFWRQAGYSGNVLTDLTFSTSWEATGEQPGRAGILTAYTMGAPGLVYANVEQGSRLLLAADELDDVFPGSRSLVHATGTIAWQNELYSRGTYVAYDRGQVVKYWRALRRPFGRLYFAGEHTDAYSGSMEGALRSGRRAAAAIVARG